MKIALIGYGAMGKLIRRLAEEKGHEVVLICTSPRVSKGETFNLSDTSLLTRGLPQIDVLARADVAIDFTVDQAVKRNVSACVAAGVPLVEGTTGWSQDHEAIEKIVRDGNGAFLFGANFSIGVNLFYRIAAFAAELFAKFPDYETFLEEQHHSRKLDAPGVTARKIKDKVAEQIKKDCTMPPNRPGNHHGTHRVGFDGAADQILLEHTARSREGFAHGAITAAEWTVGKKGFFEFTDIIHEIVSEKINHR